MTAEEIASYVRGLEHDNAALEKRCEKRMQKIVILRSENEELKKRIEHCKALWRVRV